MAAPRSRYRATSVRLPQADLDRFRAAAAVEDDGLVGRFLRRAAVRLAQREDLPRLATRDRSVTTTEGDPTITFRHPPANDESFKSAAAITDGGQFGAFIIRAGRVLAAEIEKGRRGANEAEIQALGESAAPLAVELVRYLAGVRP